MQYLCISIPHEGVFLLRNGNGFGRLFLSLFIVSYGCGWVVWWDFFCLWRSDGCFFAVTVVSYVLFLCGCWLGEIIVLFFVGGGVCIDIHGGSEDVPLHNF